MKWPRVIHWGPLVTIFLIAFIFYWSLFVLSVYWPWATPNGKVHHILFMTNVVFICVNYLHAIQHGPGFVKLGWKPDNVKNQKHLQFCQACQGFKPPRAHHCQACKRCVMKMDHHCPWINCCVGHENHATFTRFVFHAPLGCGYAFYLQGMFLYRLLFSGFVPEQAMFMFKSPTAFCFFLSIGFSLGVTLAVSVLLFYQLRSILRNRTMVEEWILDKAHYRHLDENLEPFVYPYDLGWRQNCMQVFLLSWYARGNGITWAVRNGCDQYTLTNEQLIQKQRKRARSRLFRCVTPYSGTYFPVRIGFWLCCTNPSLLDPRMRISEGDTILVSRFNKSWFYGERHVPQPADSAKSTTTSSNGDGKPQRPLMRQKGWFPAKCAEPVMEKYD